MEGRVLELSAPAAWTATVRQCARALAWTAALTGLFAIWCGIEKWGLDLPSEYRLARSPAMVPMIALAIPHILIGFLFLVTSSKVRGARGVATLAVLLAAGTGLCLLFAHAEGTSRAAGKTAVAAVALYFLVHHLRDETFFHRVFGDGPGGVAPERTQRFLDTLTHAILVAVAALAIWGYDIHAHGKSPPRAGPLDAVFPAEVGAGGRGVVVLLAAAVVVAFLVRRWAQTETVGFVEMLRRHPSMCRVYGMFFGFLVVGSLAGAVFEAIILWHVLEWLFFGTLKVTRAEASAPPARTWLERVKRTRRGFLGLHLGLAAVVFVLMGVWVYGAGKTGPLTYAVSPGVFYHWTIMHVTVSFFPR